MEVRRWVLYPILLAPYSVLAFYAQNANDTPVSELARPVVLMTAASVLVFGVLWLALREAARAGLLTLLALAVFDTVALAPEWVDEWLGELSGFWIRQNVHIWPPLVVGAELAAAAVLVRAIARLRDPDAWTSYLNLFAIILLGLPLMTIAQVQAREPDPVGEPPAAAGQPPAAVSGPPSAVPTAHRTGRPPDIYYIILDGYARTDVMSDRFGFENGPFLQRLERRGFYVARRSTANYGQTPLSLSCSLNAVYLNGRIPSTSHDKSQLGPWIGDGSVVRTLRGLGYQFVSFATGFAETEHPEADVYLAPSPYISPFHHLLLSRTPLVWVLPSPGHRDAYTWTRQRTLFLLETVPQVARRAEPTFTFAHILSPHPPFVFDEHGGDVSPRQRSYYLTDGELFRGHYGDRAAYAAGYRKQAQFLTEQVERMIDGILAHSPEPPVIILQSDHGSGMDLDTKSVEHTDLHERMSILNAYYLPGRGPGEAGLYQDISPVNSFRVVLNAYFGAGLDLLPDRSYFSTWGDPFQFLDVTDCVRDAPDCGSVRSSTPAASCGR